MISLAIVLEERIFGGGRFGYIIPSTLSKTGKCILCYIYMLLNYGDIIKRNFCVLQNIMELLSLILTFTPTLLLLLLIACSIHVVRIFSGKSITSKDYYPVAGTLYGLAFHWNRLHDYLGEVVRRHGTFRLLAAEHSEIYTTDVRIIEHVLKTNFENYPKGQYNHDIETELFGQGIFSVNGAKWRQQRKLSSHEFSTRVLRDFSCKIFRKKAANLVRTVSEFATASKNFDAHVSSLHPIDTGNFISFLYFIISCSF